ncbi:MAG: fatty acid CoA ligase family protein [Pirellulales bacterium]
MPLTNIGATICASAERYPDALALAAPQPDGDYRTFTFAELERTTNRLASALVERGVTPGMRVALLVPPSGEFIALVFALFKTGAVIILIDPGMGRQNLAKCLSEAEPEAMVGIPLAHVARLVLRHRFPKIRLNVTVGRRWLWGGPTLKDLLDEGRDDFRPAANDATDPAAIIFTSGSTGPPKGVLYRHVNFLHQVSEIQQRYGIEPGEVDLPGFPLFGLFNAAMGVSTIIPQMDATRPAQVDPRKILPALERWNVTHSFGSPAMWNTISRYCQQEGVRLKTLRRVFSAGAPVPVHLLQRMVSVLPSGAEMHTPYGATEALPVATISAAEVLSETCQRSARGAGTCVGTRFPGIEWKIVRISDGPLPNLSDCDPLPTGEVGELIVSGAVVTSEYVTRRESNAVAKIAEGQRIWHRMGDVGYVDQQDRFWFCGRKAHRVQTADGVMYSVPCEAIFNQHPRIYRSALVGTGSLGQQQPAVICEPWPEHRPSDAGDERRLLDELHELGQLHPLTHRIARSRIVWQRALPVDIRHNAKISREQLAAWAEDHLPKSDK